MKAQIERLLDDPAALERLYRRCREEGTEAGFAEAVSLCLQDATDNVLLQAWDHRLAPVGRREASGTEAASDAVGEPYDTGRRQHWATAVGIAVASGTLFALFAWGAPPVPDPGEARPLFWIGWGPLTAVALVLFVTMIEGDRARRPWHGGAAAAAVALGLVAALVAWGRTDHTAVLIAMHLPFLAWAAVGAAVAFGLEDRSHHAYAFMVRSLETLVAAGIFLGSGLVFAGLTAGLLAVFEIEVPETAVITVAAFGIGMIPVLAVASTYDPTLVPARQRPTGVARILRIMTWLLMPAALVVLGVYVVWLIPVHFWRGFEDRSVLIVYNATILAVLAFLAAAASQGEGIGERILRPAVSAVTSLTLLLNLYALAAILSRIFEYGLSPNRQTVLGWNVVTLLVLGFLLARSWSAPRERWAPVFRTAMGRAVVLPVVWALWVVCGLHLV